MFYGLEVGMVVGIETFAFPHIGTVVRFDDVSITLKDSVRVLWDGRAGEFWSGKPPSTADVEKNMPLYSISADFVATWEPYPGGKVPKPQ